MSESNFVDMDVDMDITAANSNQYIFVIMSESNFVDMDVDMDITATKKERRPICTGDAHSTAAK